MDDRPKGTNNRDRPSDTAMSVEHTVHSAVRGREGFVLISEAHPPGQAAVMAAGGGVWWPSRLPFQPQRSSVLAT